MIVMKVGIGVLLSVCLFSCMSSGTHGSIKCFNYTVTKIELETAVTKVISVSNSISQDSIKGYYNNDSIYVTIKVSESTDTNEYTFRYRGGNEYWDTSKVSCICIAYAHDKYGKGGSSGNGGVKWYDFNLKEELIGVFERGFIEEVDRELRVKHSN
jgi:hypothetical protein